jgi:Xaa-Pro dipeptidase
MVRSYAQVSTGTAETALAFRPILFSTTRKLEPGDTAVIEMAVVADGFWSDRTRVRVAGNAPGQQAKRYDIVRTAQESAIAAARAGITAGEVDEAARSVIRDAGYEKEFFHVTGHGLGFRYHEPTPLICPGSDLVLKSGMLHTVEPGIYSPDFGGFRVEDNIVITENGSEILGPANKNLS